MTFKSLTYKNYQGTIEYSLIDRTFYGKVLGIHSLISYEGKSLDSLEKDFREAINDYLEMCVKHNINPEMAPSL